MMVVSRTQFISGFQANDNITPSGNQIVSYFDFQRVLVTKKVDNIMSFKMRISTPLRLRLMRRSYDSGRMR